MMSTDPKATDTDQGKSRPRKPAWRRFARSRDGAAAIEFAILSIPYFLIIFAILETFIAFIGEQVLSNAVEVMSRKLRTGEITYQHNNTTTDRNQLAFRKDFCDEIAVVIQCSTDEIANPKRLYLDVRRFSSFADVPTYIPLVSSGQFSDLDTAEFGYSPGGPKDINMLRAYYRWQIMTDLVRSYISTIRPASGSWDFLIVATATFQNEDYP